MKLLELENFWQLISLLAKKLVAEIYIRVRMKRNFYFGSNFAEKKREGLKCSSWAKAFSWPRFRHKDFHPTTGKWDCCL